MADHTRASSTAAAARSRRLGIDAALLGRCWPRSPPPGGLAPTRWPARPRGPPRPRRPRSLRPDVPLAAVCAADAGDHGGARGAGPARRTHGRRRRAVRRAGGAHRRSVAEPQQPEQRDAHGGRNVPRTVPRPRHDVRHFVAARISDKSAAHAQCATPVLRPRLPVRRWPVGLALLYEPLDRAKLRVESGGIHEDLPRDATGRAIIADPRNDENVVIAGLQAAMLLAHNQRRRRRAPGGTRGSTPRRRSPRRDAC